MGKSYALSRQGPVLIRVPGSVTHNWFSGLATSGLVGGDVVILGTALTTTRISRCSLSTHNLALGADLNIRMYGYVNGAERKFFDDYFSVGTDPEDLLPMNGDMAIYGTVRIEMSSDKLADDGKSVDFEYLKA